jgi:hypothetical protein
MPAPKPIEGHLSDLGLPASTLNDQERREIALTILDARVRGIGFLLFEMGQFRCADRLG